MKTYIIAEIGPNHNGDINVAIELVKKLASIGVDAVKFQIGNPEKSLSLDAIKASYQKKNDNAEDIFEASRARQLTKKEHGKLFTLCRSLSIDYLCTAFDLESLIFLDKELNVPMFKIASGEIFSLDQLEYMSNQNKKIILSTGMSTFDEIETSLNILNFRGIKDVTLLHCVTNYPAPISDVNLLCMLELQKRFNTKIGYSDHTLGNDSAIAAVALGATIIEKHVTLDKSLKGPDHKASATVEEFSLLIKSIRAVEIILGTNKKVFSEYEKEIAKVARKSIISVRDLEIGEIISENDICFKRPGTGFYPIEKNKVIGKRVINKISKNRVINKKDII